MSVVGDYEYIKPGSMAKSTQKLSLSADGKATYSEVGSTGMENFSSSGYGSWKIQGGVCMVFLEELTKTMEFTVKTNVPGIEDGSSVKQNVTIPITADELLKAPRHGTNKWRKC